MFEARRGSDSYMVDLDNRVCSCRLWDLSGIPCVHAIAAINYIHQTPEQFLNDYFSVEKFKECYYTNISPVNGSNLWPETDFIKPLPPLARRMPGRPKVNRRRHVSENEGMVHTPRTVRCGKCYQFGHNSKTCKNATRLPRPTPPKKIGRPRKYNPVPLKEQSQASQSQPNSVPPGPNQASGSNTTRGAKKLGVRRGGGRGGNVRSGPSLFDVDDASLVDQVHVDQVNANLFDVDDASLVDVIILEEGEKDVDLQADEGVDVDLKADEPEGIPEQKTDGVFDEVEDAMDKILGVSEKSQSEPEGIPEPEFTEGNASGVLPEMIILDVEQVAELLEA